MELHTRENTNQPVHVQIPEVNLCESIRFGHFRTIFFCQRLLFGFLRSMTVPEECSECWLEIRIAGRLRVLWQGTGIRPVFTYGGGSATGSGGKRAGESGRRESCAQNGKWITSSAAIVAPQPCDCGQGRVGVCASPRPAISLSLFLTLLASAFTPIMFGLVFLGLA